MASNNNNNEEEDISASIEDSRDMEAAAGEERETINGDLNSINFSTPPPPPSTTLPPSLPRPIPFGESRDVSASSREGLRRELQRRQQALTTPEKIFLDHLVIHGNEIEVALAFEKLSDTDLFFDSFSQNDGDIAGDDRDACSVTTNTSNRTIPKGAANGNGIAAADATNTSIDSATVASPGAAAAPPPRCESPGTSRRLAQLEARRNSNVHGKIWKAHESGLAVTTNASRLSIISRVPYGGGNVKGAGLNSSFHSRSSSRSGMPMQSQEDAIFRGSFSSRLPPRKPKLTRAQSALPPRRESIMSRSEGRSSSSSRKSVTFDLKPMESASERVIPSSNFKRPPRMMHRSVSDSAWSSPSDEIKREEEKEHEDEFAKPGIVSRVNESISSIPSIRPATAIRSGSISSIPSIRPANAIRSDSIASIPSIHRATLIRSESAASVASSVRRTIGARTGSMGSIPSIHRAERIGSTSELSYWSTDTHESDFLIHRRLERPLTQHDVSDQLAAAWGAATMTNLPTDVSIPTSNSVPPKDTVTTIISDDENPSRQKPVLLRVASKNDEGIEVTAWSDENHVHLSHDNNPFPIFSSMCDLSVRSAISFDETTVGPQSLHDGIFRGLRRSLSDEDMGAYFVGSSASLLMRDGSGRFGDMDLTDDLDASWSMHSESGRFDSWNILKDEYINGYGGGDTLGFRILGTSANDESAKPHVLSPPLMESLQSFLPFSKSGENFHLKYSMVRDGASLHTFLQQARGTKYTILALETVDGEVLGSFTAQTWRKNWNYFGTGESFLWKMRQSRLVKCSSIIEQAHLESEIEVYPFTGENKFVQLCTNERIAVGGGAGNCSGSLDVAEAEKKDDDIRSASPVVKEHEWGFGLAINGDLMQGTSSPCLTFGSPSLSTVHADGTPFEIVNIELWTLTPCMTVEEAEKLELGKLFLQREAL